MRRARYTTNRKQQYRVSACVLAGDVSKLDAQIGFRVQVDYPVRSRRRARDFYRRIYHQPHPRQVARNDLFHGMPVNSSNNT